jgi:tricorn protease
MKKIIILSLFLGSSMLFAQINARLFQYPDVSDSEITFSYAGDIWVAPITGGTAHKLSSPKGQEILPKFSPDGKKIAFSGNYNGNIDIYVISHKGGIPHRVTYHPSTDRMLDWMPDGKNILFASARESGRQRFDRLFTIPATSGLAKKLPVPYGEFASVSADGKMLAYTPRTRLFRTWKRYRGGMATDIWLFNLKTFDSKNITDEAANDEMPMFRGDNIYFLSDRGTAERFNIWVYNIKSEKFSQLTFFKKFDVHFPSIGPKDIIFEAGGNLYLLNLENQKYSKVKINIISDQIALIPEKKNVSKYITHVTPSPDGNRVVIEARGELFSVPKEKGVVYNLTNSSGSAERYPAWSPDGKRVAYWSDASGEYQLTLKDMSKIDSHPKTLTNTKSKFKYNIFWSPNSDKLVYIDNAMRIRLFDINSKEITDIDKALYKYEGGLESFTVSWSKDGRFVTYSRGLDNQHDAIFIYDTENEKTHQVTSGYYSDSHPVFDPDGKYIYYLTNRHFSPIYSSVNNNFIYANTTRIAAVPLTTEIKSPLAPKNDEVKAETKKSDSPKKDNDKAEKKEAVKIDFNRFESRAILLPPDAGNYSNLNAVSGKVLYIKYPNTGSTGKSSPIKYFDLKDRKEKTVVKNASGFDVTADGKNLLVVKGRSFYIIGIGAGKKLEKAVPVKNLVMTINPKEEWTEIFTDAWRMERDFFYDPNMHGVDWNEVRSRYGNLVKFAASRWDLNFLLGEMIGELSSSHTYKGGGDTEKSEHRNVGLLGINWSEESGHYKIAKIIKGAEWDVSERSPLSEPGIKIKQGDYILAVNGEPLDINKEPYAAFETLGGKTVELTVNNKPDFEGAWKVIVKTKSNENRLRNLAWIEQKRKHVEEATDGKVGYIYVRSTGIDGQDDLVRQYLAQIDKEGLIIDERFNSGGQIPDRFIELLNKKALAYWAVRDGKTWTWPPQSQLGHKVMLINGWSGSGGDAFPDFFRNMKLGKLIGERTWGGLIGISGVPSLIDGGMITVPTFRMYNPDGTWFKEGHGVDPDILVVDNPTQMAKGVDPQLEKAIDVVTNEIKMNPPVTPKHPPYEKR